MNNKNMACVYAMMFFALYPINAHSQITGDLKTKLDCNSNATVDLMKCYADGFAKVNGRLKDAYRAALGAMPAQDQSDSRKSRIQLEKSEKAWKQYRDENCLLRGGLEGGNNGWVAIFSDSCRIDETESRIKFLSEITKSYQ